MIVFTEKVLGDKTFVSILQPPCPPQTSGGMSRAMKSLDPVYSQLNTGHSETGDKDQDVKRDNLHAGVNRDDLF